jgi:hypothetical protein
MTLADRYHAMGDEEFASLVETDLTAEARPVYQAELRRRQSPDYVEMAEAQKKAQKVAAYAAEVEAQSRAEQRAAIKRRARPYAAALTVLTVIGVGVMETMSRQSSGSPPPLTVQERINRKIHEDQLAQLKPEDRRFVEELERGRQSGAVAVDSAMLGAGVGGLAYLAWLWIVRMVLGARQRRA